jgi:hypothetical protein
MMDAKESDFVEAAIYVATEGEQWGRYVASCAKDLCGYYGRPSSASYTLTGSSYASTKCLSSDSTTSQALSNVTTVVVSDSEIALEGHN